MKSLSKREKIMIYVLLIIIICVCGVALLCMPAIEKNGSLSSQFNTLTNQYEAVQKSVVKYENMDKKIEEASKTYNSQISSFITAANTKTEDVDQLVTSLVKKYLLTPTSLDISEITSEKVVKYNSQKTDENDANDENATGDSTTKTDKDANQDSTENKDEGIDAKVYSVNMKVKGAVNNLYSMIDEASQTNCLKVDSIDYTMKDTGIVEVTLSFKLYMI